MSHSFYTSSHTEFWLYEPFRNNEFEWVISNEILSEYFEQLSKFYNVQTATVVIKIFTTRLNVIFSEPFFKWGLIDSDPDDNKFVDLAISSNSNYLVTNDHHFDVLNQLDFPSIKVVTLNEFQILMGY